MFLLCLGFVLKASDKVISFLVYKLLHFDINCASQMTPASVHTSISIANLFSGIICRIVCCLPVLNSPFENAVVWDVQS